VIYTNIYGTIRLYSFANECRNGFDLTGTIARATSEVEAKSFGSKSTAKSVTKNNVWVAEPVQCTHCRQIRQMVLMLRCPEALVLYRKRALAGEEDEGKVLWRAFDKRRSGKLIGRPPRSATSK